MVDLGNWLDERYRVPVGQDGRFLVEQSDEESGEGSQ
jgi:endogenous inhibitor of DNA gyrase (YacG/DUF329 family)